MKNLFLIEGCHPATLFQRTVAVLLDYLVISILFVLWFALGTVLRGLMESLNNLAEIGTDNVAGVWLGLSFMLIAVYYTRFWKGQSQSLGERVMGMRVLSVEREQIGLTACIIRFIFLIPFLTLVSLLYYCANQRQSLADLVSGTATVREEQQ